MSRRDYRRQWLAGYGYEDGWAGPAEEPAVVARRLCDRTLEITERRAGEAWISSVLGRWEEEAQEVWSWRVDDDEPEDRLDEAMFVVAAPIARELASLGGPGASALLHGIWLFGQGRLARFAGEMLDTLPPGSEPPVWTYWIGEDTATKALGQRRPSGAEVIAIELHHAFDGSRWLVAFGGTYWGKNRIDVCETFDAVEEFAREVARKNAKPLPFEEMPTEYGCLRAHRAIANVRGPGAGPFPELRAWGLAVTGWNMSPGARRRQQERLAGIDCERGRSWGSRSLYLT